MRLYDNNGYVNIPEILKHEATFIFIYGGRGTGKTYGALKEMIEGEHHFIYMRRLAAQTDIVKKESMQPYKTLNDDMGWSIQPFPINKYISAFYESDVNEDGKVIPVGDQHGLLTSLSTFSNLRGVDGSDIDTIILDEFIPELNERPIKGEADALFNAYETINRNRELKGEDPVKLLCLANSNRIDNPLFMELKLVRKAEKIRQDGKEYLYDPKRKMLLIDLYKSQISEAKSDTALYQLTKGTEFYEMAIRNSFINEERGRIETRPIKEYRPVVSIGEITVYKHKSRREYYITTFRSGSPDSYTTGEKDRERFRKKYLYLWQCYMRREVVFEEYMSEILFDKYFH
ncbi:MAG: phage DNA encapsidation protein [Erysipelotrichaceae bacterium]|nr:phage DNA encapsidation protein [Erysipelotrichaceae bacterium]